MNRDRKRINKIEENSPYKHEDTDVLSIYSTSLVSVPFVNQGGEDEEGGQEAKTNNMNIRDWG